MHAAVVWTDVAVKVGAGDVRKVEAVWKVRLPQDLVACILVNNGGRPSKDVFDLKVNACVLDRLLRFDEGSDAYVLSDYEAMLDRLVDWVFPIADDVFGNSLCLDYRKGRENPSIVFWDHEAAYANPEAALTHVAGSFTEFLGLLYVSDLDPSRPLDPKVAVTDLTQFRHCIWQFAEAIRATPPLGKQFSSSQLAQLFQGKTPDGFTWHHHQVPGRIQLVNRRAHKATGHTGGRTIWGAGGGRGGV